MSDLFACLQVPQVDCILSRALERFTCLVDISVHTAPVTTNVLPIVTAPVRICEAHVNINRDTI